MRSEVFEETLKQHKDSLTDELEQLGKHRQAQLVEWDIEQNESNYEFYFNAGWSAQQSKVDELTKHSTDLGQRYNEQAQRIKDLEYWNDKLQKQLNERDLRIKRLIESEENIARGCAEWRNACSKLWKVEEDLLKRINTSQDIIESILARSLDKPEIQKLCCDLIDVLEQPFEG